jgi:CRP/FNR family transcriptional regulator
VSGILDALTPEDRERLIAEGRRHTVPSGETIVRADDVNASLWIVESGRVEVRLGGEGATRTAGSIGPGGFFGEVSLFEPGLTTAAVIAREEAGILELPKQLLESFGEERPAAIAGLYAAILKELSERIRTMDRELADSVYWLFE